MHEFIAFLPCLAVAGIVLGSVLTFQFMSWRELRRIQKERYLEYTKRRLEEFYGPLSAMLAEMKSRKEIFRTIQDGATEEYLTLKKQREFRKAERLNADREYLAQKELERFRMHDLPICRDMHSLFRMKGWMGEKSTREILGSIAPLLEIWELQANRPLELNVFAKIVDQNKFFEELEADLTDTQNVLIAEYQAGMHAGIIEALNFNVKVLRGAEPSTVEAIPVDDELLAPV